MGQTKDYLDLRPLPPNMVTPWLHKELSHHTSFRDNYLPVVTLRN